MPLLSELSDTDLSNIPVTTTNHHPKHQAVSPQTQPMAEVKVTKMECLMLTACKRYLDDLMWMNTTDVYFHVNEVLTKAEVAK